MSHMYTGRETISPCTPVGRLSVHVHRFMGHSDRETISPRVANAGKTIHDGVGKYVLPSNHSVLVLSDRCQLVVMGKHAVGLSDWSPKCWASGDGGRVDEPEVGH